MSKKVETSKKKHRIAFRCDDELYNFHYQEAMKQKRSMSNYMTILLTEIKNAKEKQSQFFFGD